MDIVGGASIWSDEMKISCGSRLQANMEEDRMNSIGIDVGKKRCRASITDQHGRILDELSFTNDSAGIRNLLSKASRYGMARKRRFYTLHDKICGMDVLRGIFNSLSTFSSETVIVEHHQCVWRGLN
jgi:hypothetical protein